MHNTAGNLTNKITKDFCPICFEDVGHFARHLFRKHSDEETKKKKLQMPLKSNKRRTAIILLRKKGNFILNEQKRKLKTKQSKILVLIRTTISHVYIALVILKKVTYGGITKFANLKLT